MIILIAAVAENLALGKNNELLWHLPDDFKRFKQLTTGHYIIMGRKTFESFPKPLPNRTHIIITRQKDYLVPEGCFVVASLAEALAMVPENEDTYVIGGGEIYQLALPEADAIELTKVHASLPADTFFPEVDLKHWKLIASKYHPKDEKHQYDFTFETYLRI
ncbi:dihydrofolate reductase [Flavobacterium sp. CYK-4]|uniref:dihydrofolate reductase n=1 Tax=Flavobacterium lotistagni TaxID=2709660 RepID=UPI001408ECFD|nr:dihydrofolate reductase [Flavobacterium lotistagni]NHM05806.1 dihydrofolate reductase [Flavobacterium lotistagni]